MVRHCARGRPPLPSPSPTLRTAARDTVPQRRGLFSGAARTLPGSSRRANEILYIRVRRREGENVLHRAASNDVDNFSVDNPLWITAAAGCRLFCGGRGRRCGGSVNAGTKVQTRTGGCGSHSAVGRRLCGESVNAGTEVQTRTGRVRKSSRAMGTRRRRLSAPWLQFHGADRADVYIIIHVRACCCGECALNPPTSQPTPRRRPPLAPAQRHALAEHFRSLPEHFRSPAPRRCIPRRPHNTFPVEDLLPPPRSDAPCPSIFSLPPRADAHPQAARCIPRRPHNTFLAEDLRSPPHNDAPFPGIFSLPSRALPLPRPATMHARRPHHPFLAKSLRPSLHSDTHCPHTSAPPRRLRHAFLAALTTHSPPKAVARPRSVTLPPLPFHFGHKKTAPHSGCAMPNVSVDRRCGRSFGLVSRALFAAVAGRWRVGVGLRPQPWALRSRRCGRVLRA